MAVDPDSFESEAMAFWLKWCDGDGDEGILRFARWCADRELEGCGEWLKIQGYHPEVYRELRAARRPNPERSAKVALNLLDDISDRLDAAHENGIRRALERLQELEKDVTELPTPVVNEPPTEIV